jgi:hypothetical protein
MRDARKLLLLSILSSILFACDKKNSEINNFKKFESYFGFIPGRFVVYDVQEIFHDETAEIKHDTLIYQLKTLIGDTFTDNSGRIARKYLRFKRNNSSQNWILSDVWTSLIDGNYAETNEENQRIVKMLFPISSKTIWNANVFNVSSSMDCFYDKIHESISINGIDFDSTVRIEQENERNLIEFKRKYEVYGNQIGLISKYFKDLKISNFDTLNIKSGHELIYTCTDFGIE